VHSLYVYYRVQTDRSGEARQAIEAMFERLHADTGVRGRLLSKRDESTLWMEVYDAVSDPVQFEIALASALAAAGVERFIAAGSARKTECFVG
jgi:hypothetical protein